MTQYQITLQENGTTVLTESFNTKDAARERMMQLYHDEAVCNTENPAMRGANFTEDSAWWLLDGIETNITITEKIN